jgi:sterol desaturase/sphingolipid hydroxylase (fatty acid hydroxylase superfamily)
VLDAVTDYLLAPYRSSEVLLASVTGMFRALLDFNSALNWVYLASSLAVAIAVYWSRRDGEPFSVRRMANFLFPAAIYSHRSALVDYRFVAVDLTIRALVYVPLITLCGATMFWLGYKLAIAFAGILSHLPFLGDWPRTAMAMTVVIAVLAVDFCMFLAHYLQHRIPLLWCFHQVHHSAEVLTPITVHRKHPVEDLVFAMIAPALSGMGTALYLVGTGESAELPKLLGVGAGQLVAFMAAYHLRHSHIWLSFGPVLNRVFISPAQHQIHHSKEPRHRNCNYGFLFAFWDSLFGSLYVPRHREDFAIGIADADPADFASVRKLYFLPFAKAAGVLRAWLAMSRKPEASLRR